VCYYKDFTTAEIVKLTVAPSCPDLTTIDISKNELTSLPASITKLPNLERLNASKNCLIELPAR
jgi:Leucine-rich repeat (LRR) protein